MNWFQIEKTLLWAISIAIVCPWCLSAFVFSHDAMAGTRVVVPPGLEEVKGGSVGMRSAHLGSSVIWQELWPASEFLGVAAGQNAIVAMNLRPDTVYCRPREAQFETYELRLSTTDAVPGTLDRVFSQNKGDDEVVVYSGPLGWETDCSGPTEGPRDFDYIVDFQTPFLYDPSLGRNLLVEERASFQTDVAPFSDAQNLFGEGVRAIAALPHTAPVAQGQLERVFVRQFEFVPVPTALQAGDADMDCDFDQMDLVQVQLAAKYMTGEAATWGEGDWNGAPGGSVEDKIPPPGDGQFNQLDIVAVLGAATYLQGSYCADEGARAFAIPEPSTCLLLAIGRIAMLSRWRRKR